MFNKKYFGKYIPPDILLFMQEKRSSLQEWARALPAVFFILGLCLFFFSYELLDYSASLTRELARLSEKAEWRRFQLDNYQHLLKKKAKPRSSDTAFASLQVVLSSVSSSPDFSLRSKSASEQEMHISALPLVDLIKVLNDVQRVSGWIVSAINVSQGIHKGEVNADVTLRLLGESE